MSGFFFATAQPLERQSPPRPNIEDLERPLPTSALLAGAAWRLQQETMVGTRSTTSVPTPVPTDPSQPTEWEL